MNMNMALITEPYLFALGDIYCGEIHEKIAAHSNTMVAPLGTGGKSNSCFVFDEDVFKSGQGSISPEIKKFCLVSFTD